MGTKRDEVTYCNSFAYKSFIGGVATEFGNANPLLLICLDWRDGGTSNAGSEAHVVFFDDKS